MDSAGYLVAEMYFYERSVTQTQSDGYEQFRHKFFKHLYYCSKCIRNFQTHHPEAICRICGTELKELVRDDVKQYSEGKRKMRYYCPKCLKTFDTESYAKGCKTCGSAVIHYYPWNPVKTRHKILLKVNDLRKGFSPSGIMKSRPKVSINRKKLEFKKP